ncbi:MAG: Omp28-related outer membrane protein [Bacteroidales bacterium]|nr:Omp28-related outer membrane protein [Bacteroidales bacterium]MCI7654188.1 Omp28-related outer membrane protein [Bacteroidales bacterium]MDD7706447.1 Omp28-related outer membrane protein [Bacteroidales bacterium]MDY4704974.1 Omp28-related outer membrane protein [Prevotella sp.]
MKKSILLLAAFAMTMTANAQKPSALKVSTVKAERLSAVAPSQPSMLKAPRKADLAANQRLVGYYATDDVDNSLGVGNYTTEDIEPAIFLQQEALAPYVGKKVTAVRFAMGASSTAKGVTIYTVDAEGNINALASKDTTFASKSTNTSYVWNTVVLPADKQFNITADQRLMVAYKVTQGSRTYPIGVNTSVNGDLYINCNIPASVGGQGKGWYSFGAGNGAAAIQMLVEGDFAAYNAIPSSIEKIAAVAGQDVKVTIPFFNLGASAITNVDYVLTVDGVAADPARANFNPGVATGAYGNLTFTVPAGDVDAVKNLSVKITKVNGEDNASADVAATGQIGVSTTAYNRNVVVEEFTTEKCPNCPRVAGYLHTALETADLTRTFAVCHHSAYYTDWLTQSCDEDLTTLFNDAGYTYAPAMMFNRQPIFDSQYASGEKDNVVMPMSAAEITSYINAQLAELSNVGLTINAEPNADTTQVTLTVSGTCNNAYDKTKGLLTVYMTEDNIKAKSQNGATGTFYHQHVIRYFNSSWGDAIEWKDDNTFTKSYTIDIKKAYVKNQLKFVAFVNKHNANDVFDNQIENSIGVSLIGSTTGINNVYTSAEASNDTVVARYNEAGQRIAGAQRGLNILKLANGKTVKVIVK